MVQMWDRDKTDKTWGKRKKTKKGEKNEVCFIGYYFKNLPQ